MSLDFGFEKLPRKEFEMLKDKHEYYEMDEKELIHPELIANFCGRGNIAENWFRNAFNYIEDYDGIMFRPLSQYDLYAVMEEIMRWIKTRDIKPVFLSAGYYIDDNDCEYKNVKIDGIEIAVSESGDTFCRLSIDDINRLFMSTYHIDNWDINITENVINILINILETFDWDNDVLLYYVSY